MIRITIATDRDTLTPIIAGVRSELLDDTDGLMLELEVAWQTDERVE